MKKILLSIFLMLNTLIVDSQSLKVVKYSITKESQILNQNETINHYWKIDTMNYIELNNIKFYAFEFSTDSILVRDFININPKTKEYLFISSHLAKKDKKESDIQKFNLSKNGKYKVNSFGAMGSINQFKVKQKGVLTILDNTYIEDIVPSNSLYVEQLIFTTEPFPIIIVFSMGGKTKYIANAEW